MVIVHIVINGRYLLRYRHAGCVQELQRHHLVLSRVVRASPEGIGVDAACRRGHILIQLLAGANKRAVHTIGLIARALFHAAFAGQLRPVLNVLT